MLRQFEISILLLTVLMFLCAFVAHQQKRMVAMFSFLVAGYAFLVMAIVTLVASIGTV